MDQPGSRQAEVEEAGCIGKAGFAHDMGIGDEKQALPRLFILFRRHESKGQSKAGHSPCLLQQTLVSRFFQLILRTWAREIL